MPYPLQVFGQLSTVFFVEKKRRRKNSCMDSEISAKKIVMFCGRYANVMVVMAFSFAGRFLFGALVKRVWCFLLCTFIGLVQLLWMARLQRQHPTDEAGPIVPGLNTRNVIGSETLVPSNCDSPATE